MSVIQGNAFSDDDAVDTGDIGHSLRFRGAQHLNRTFGTPTANTSWACSWWQKDCTDGATKFVLGAGLAGFGFHSSNVFRIWDNSGGAVASSTALFRDPTGHSHWFVRSNGTNIKAYRNNEEVASYTGTISVLNSAVAHYFGRYANAAQDYLNDYISRFAFVDNGGSLTPSDFIQFNTEINEWVTKSQSAVKAVVDAGGTNSFMLDFDDATSLTTLGNDFSSKNNDWTLNGFSLTAGTTYDWMLDVPGNSYATLNPLDAMGTMTLTEGNLKGTQAAASHQNRKGTVALPTTGKWYWEQEAGSNTGASSVVAFGVANSSAAVNAQSGSAGTFSMQNDANHDIYNGVTGVLTGTGGNVAAGVIRQVAYDADTGKLWFGEANVFASSTDLTSGNPGAGTGQCMTLVAGEYFPYISCYANSLFMNFGQRPFSYTPPTGFKALCQANLPDVAAAVLNPTDGFVAVTATEDNIDSTLASARSGWSDFVDVKKNRAAAESWAWQLSHDSSNEYAISNATKTYQAKRAMSGANTWMGYSIRIGTAYGTAAGASSHTNGVATTVTHSLGTTRQAILLFPRAAGSVVPFFHAGCTAGSLLDLCNNAGQAASTAITSVGSNSFQIGSGQATGTYDYVVISEVAGWVKLFSYAGNSSSDGPYVDFDGKSMWAFLKNISGVNQWMSWDGIREPSNPAQTILIPNSTNAETTSYHADFLSRAFKPRVGAGFAMNDTGSTYVGVSWPSVAGKYSLGR